MRIVRATNRREVSRLLETAVARDPAFERRVARIVADVRARGEGALREYARRFDGLRGAIEVPPAEIRRGARRVPRDVRRALANAARHIERVASTEVPRASTTRVAPGITIERRVTPLDRVGCYVPAGRYPLPSSLLMTAVPARVAGVKEILVVCPRPAPVVLAAALEAGVTRLFRLGGAHAVAALAYGAGAVPRVDKIVGPGSRFVAVAKAMVAPDCAIDFYAGPTEIVVVAGDGDADWIAADLVAQAEHDPEARALFVTWRRALAKSVARAVLARLPAYGPARASIARRGAVILAASEREAIALVNRAAAEHVACGSERLARQISRAGAIFVGRFAAQAAGDYATGSNHVLPTGGAARFRGGLSAADFVRTVSVQRVTRAGLRAIAPTAIALARAEGLEAHAQSIEVRLRP